MANENRNMPAQPGEGESGRMPGMDDDVRGIADEKEEEFEDTEDLEDEDEDDEEENEGSL